MREYRPNWTVRVLAGVVSFACFLLLVAGVLVLLGLPAVKLVAGNNPDWVIGLTVPVALLDLPESVTTRWGSAELQVENVRGSLRLPVGTLPWGLFAVAWSYYAVTAALVLMFVHHLRRIFQRVEDGGPFDVANAKRLRWLGLIALAIALLRGAAELVTSLAVSRGVVSDRFEVPLGLSIDGWVVFFGLVLLALAEIFRRGAELEEEQSLTV